MNYKKQILAFLLPASLALPTAVLAQSSEIVLTDFEKGTQKWERRGNNVSVKSSDKEAATGSKSLQVKGRTEFWQGAQLNVTGILSRGKTYRLTASVKLEEGMQPAVLKMTMQRGDNRWDTLAVTNASDAVWSTFSGTFRPDGGDPYLLVFIESEDPRVSYYIDDFKIEAFELDENQKGVLIKTDFQDGTAQNWLVHGQDVQVFSGMIGRSFVLKVDGRKESWQGLALDISPMLFKGRTYRMSISTMLGGGAPKDTIRLRVRRTSPEGKVTFDEVASADNVTELEWVRLSGDYEVKEEGSFLLIVEAAGSKTSFFIDDFELSVP